jgi:hypothetical protein
MILFQLNIVLLALRRDKMTSLNISFDLIFATFIQQDNFYYSINQMIKITEYISYTKYAIERHLVLVQSGSV